VRVRVSYLQYMIRLQGSHFSWRVGHLKRFFRSELLILVASPSPNLSLVCNSELIVVVVCCVRE